MTDQLEALQKLLTDAIFDEAALAPALQTLADYCDAPIAQFAITDQRSTLLESAFAGVEHDDIAAMEAEYWCINPRAQALTALAPDRVVTDRDVITPEQIRTNPAYQELLIPKGFGHFAGSIVEKTSERMAAFGIFRPFRIDPFGAAEITRFQAATATCKPVLDLMHRIHKRDARVTLDALAAGTAAAILSSSGRVRDMTPAFNALVAESAVHISNDGLLDLKDRAANGLLESILRAPMIGDRRKFLLKRRGGCGLIAEVLPMPSLGAIGAGNATALIVLEAATVPTALDQKLAAEIYGLTRAEAETAAALVQGHSPRDIAVAQNVRITTVRTHIKSLRAKTESHRQAEIVAKLGQLKMKAPNHMDETS